MDCVHVLITSHLAFGVNDRVTHDEPSDDFAGKIRNKVNKSFSNG